jgi:3-isopropylmalate dehydrogenase
VANPVAAILSGALLLDYLADRRDDPAPRAAARRIEAAVEAATASGAARTADVGGTATTAEANAAIVRALG